ncbi:cytochrome b/b6 domain-containing protein [Ramlibacter sp. AW1]|uniref:Cytochrome b/b6 domain-containing protein n=1 Tax=Ramlibacter aurantiacus TaxID=2801330 RepID=A0A937D9L4_9BURK|nr:cytochrome b/b6 domain-containing protein [Ramlibacter aurantiacus]MBL0423306.1 cytochrome b/b6 domain-containing protein [Ramlibacter aurantiacus]
MTEVGTVRVWDLPTRLFHWLLVLCLMGLFATAWIPGAPLEVHVRLGYVVLTLLLFRLAWGLVGGYWSRFLSFIPSPGTVLRYLRGHETAAHRLGHSPLGALSVLAMLLVLAVQVGTGLVSDDEISFTGPLNRHVTQATGLAATSYHRGIGPWIILALIASHVVAIGYYAFVRKRNLVPAMLHGDKPAPPAQIAASRDGAVQRLFGLVLLAASAALVWLLVRGG